MSYAHLIFMAFSFYLFRTNDERMLEVQWNLLPALNSQSTTQRVSEREKKLFMHVLTTSTTIFISSFRSLHCQHSAVAARQKPICQGR